MPLMQIQVRAHDRSCGGGQDSAISYSLRARPQDDSLFFALEPDSGKLCLANALDFERRQRFQLTVLAHGQGGRDHQHRLGGAPRPVPRLKCRARMD